MTNLKNVDIAELLDGLKSERTVEAYGLHWQRYIEFAAERQLALEDSDSLTAWRKFLVRETKESPNTINLRLSSVKSIFKELANRKLVSRESFWAMRDVEGVKPNVLAKRKKAYAQVRIEPDDMRRLIEYPEIGLGNPAGARNRALLLLLATSGVRISEAIAVKVEDLQRHNGHHMIANILGKGQAKARIAPLSAEAYAAIQDWLFVRPVKGDYVFTSLNYLPDGNILYSDVPMTQDSAYGIVKRICIACGLPHAKPHDFRRFVGTQLAKINVRTAQKALGHAKISTTAAHYVLDDEAVGVTEGLF